MSDRVEAARDAFYQARWEQKKPLDPIRFGVEWADAHPQPRTITRSELAEAFARAGTNEVTSLLRELGIEVRDE